MRPDIGEWPADDLPEGWTWCDFGDFFEDVTSSTKKLPTNKYQSSGKYHVIDQSAGSQSGWTDDDTLVHPCPPPVVTFGDHTRFVRLVNHPFVQGADGMKVFRPRFDALFAFFAMLTIELPDKGYSRHFSYLRASRFPLPPLPEQRRIVAKLDELRARSRKAREALASVPALLDKLKQSVLAAAFRGDLTAEWRAAQPPGSVEPASLLLDRIRAERRKRWEQANPKKQYVEPEPVDTSNGDLPELPEGWCWAPWFDVFDFQGGTQPPKSTFRDAPGHGLVRLLQIRDFADDRFAVYIEDRPSLSKCAETDILLGRYGASVGRVLTGKAGAYNVALVRVDFERRTLSPEWAFHYLSSDHFQRPLQLLSRSAQNGFNKTEVAHFRVPLAPFTEQAAMAVAVEHALERIRSASETVVRQAKSLDSLDQSILAQAFRGELVPQDPNDETADKLLARLRSAGPSAQPSSGRGRKRKVAS